MANPAPEEIARVREEGRRRRDLSDSERRRAELAPVVDVGTLSDEDVLILHNAYTSGLTEPRGR